ncbi:MAG TPA: condensation domain-containing protein [Ruminiclostridium sp.]|nr:condensation domain-containing protein [Ruminiclostridium sp.]
MKLSKFDIFEKIAKKELSKEEALILLKEGHGLSGSDDSKVDIQQVNEYPLSEGQKALWFIENMSEGSYAYNLPGALRIDRDVDVTLLKKAMSKCWERHPALRTVFIKKGWSAVSEGN